MGRSNFILPQHWYAGLPAAHAAAGALLTDRRGRVLLVKAHHRKRWSFPGGAFDHGEAPHQACAREIAEELGLTVDVGRLLLLDWVPADDGHPRPLVMFIFDCPPLEDDAEIRLQYDELDDYAFLPPQEALTRLTTRSAARLSAALGARAAGRTAYLPSMD